MSFYLPQTEKNGDIPHLSKIDRKPKPIGAEIKNCADGNSEIMLGLEIQEGKVAMSKAKYVGEYGYLPTAACARRLVDMPKTCFKTQKRAVPRFRIILDAGFGNMSTLKALSAAKVEAIMCIKHGRGGMPKNQILQLSKDWTAGASLTLRCETKIRIKETGEVVRPIFVFYKSGA